MPFPYFKQNFKLRSSVKIQLDRRFILIHSLLCLQSFTSLHLSYLPSVCNTISSPLPFILTLLFFPFFLLGREWFAGESHFCPSSLRYHPLLLLLPSKSLLASYRHIEIERGGRRQEGGELSLLNRGIVLRTAGNCPCCFSVILF